MASKLLKSRILYKGFLRTNTSKIIAPVKISLNLLENIVEKDIYSVHGYISNHKLMMRLIDLYIQPNQSQKRQQ